MSEKPCPNCGHCPTCGHSPQRVYPWPYGTSSTWPPSPYYDTGTGYAQSGGSVSGGVQSSGAVTVTSS